MVRPVQFRPQEGNGNLAVLAEAVREALRAISGHSAGRVSQLAAWLRAQLISSGSSQRSGLGPRPGQVREV